MKKCTTLQELLYRASSFPKDHGIGFIDAQGITHFTSYQQLYNLAGRGATVLKSMTAQKEAIIVLKRNEDIVQAFWACVYAGIVPTILQAPMSFEPQNQSLIKLKNVAHLLDNPVIIWDEPSEACDSIGLDNTAVYWGKCWEILETEFAQTRIAVQQHDRAYVQFSSGSTGLPKGVSLTHNNILNNLEAISIGLQFHPFKPTVNWMPLYHDMGLMGYHLTTLFASTPQYHIDTLDFVRNPYLWLDALSDKKAGITGCPNFGLVLTNRYLKRRPHNENWDFSAMEGMLNGAEPISPRVMYEFNELLAPYKFSPKAMMPVYGMAEATLAISFTDYFADRKAYHFSRTRIVRDNFAEILPYDHPDAMEIVAVGKALKNIAFRIVDEDNELKIEQQIGHIQIKGASVTKGYYSKEANKDLFTADGWLRTGDMGFVYDGQLFISGRFKDIIFFGGRNLYAHDFEYIAQQIEGLQYGKVVFNGYFDDQAGQDRVICFLAGISPSKREMISKELKSLIMDRMGVSTHEIVWVKPIQIPKTSSGKLQRYKLLDAFLKGEIQSS